MASPAVPSVDGSGTSAPSTAKPEMVWPAKTAGAGFSISTFPVTVGVALKYQFTDCVVTAGVGASASSQYVTPEVSEALFVEEAVSSWMVPVIPLNVKVSIMVPAAPDTSVRNKKVASLTFPFSGATMDATFPVIPETNCISTLTSLPAMTDDAVQLLPAVKVGVVVPLVE